jgi:hypothetical protein
MDTEKYQCPHCLDILLDGVCPKSKCAKLEEESKFAESLHALDTDFRPK